MLKLSCGILLLSCALVKETLGQTGLTDADKEAILDAHNRLRGQVNPSASNMETMVWSDELAQVAQSYAEVCIFEHNNDRQSQQSTFSSVGENLAAGTGDADFPGFVQSWYDEVGDYNLEANNCSTVCGHYTQVVWATSRNVGCGAFRCDNLQNFMPNAINFVCNYGPAGNFIGQRPYIAGTSCSACPVDLPNCANQLCSLESIETSGTPHTGMSTVMMTTTEMNNQQSTSKMKMITQRPVIIILASILAAFGIQSSTNA